MTLTIDSVAVASGLTHGLDVITGFDCIQTAFLGAFGLNEMLSILENIGRVHPHFGTLSSAARRCKRSPV